MNRLELLDSNLVADSERDGGDASTAATTEEFVPAVPTHALFVPKKYEPGYAYPLVVWLHGDGGDERQLGYVMPSLSTRNYVAVSPRGTVASDPDHGKGGYLWEQSEDHIFLAQQRVLSAIDVACERCHVAPERIFVAGLDSGGTMAVRMALNYPERFAGGLSLSGPFPKGHRPLRHFNQVRRKPLFMAIGSESTAYPQGDVCRDLRLFHSADMKVTLHQYPGGDELTTDMLEDMDRWIMSQISSSTAASIEINSIFG